MPTDIILDGLPQVNEIANVGYQVGDLVCQDPDLDQTCSFDVIGKFNDTFNVSDITLTNNFLTEWVWVLAVSKTEFMSKIDLNRMVSVNPCAFEYIK